jgi:predicted molibdopterin-dependent oxidoreductase YjgC
LSGPETADQNIGTVIWSALYASLACGVTSKINRECGQHMTGIIHRRQQAIGPKERLIDLINRSGIDVPHVCYRPQLGPIQSCDTCMVEVDSKLVRACGAMALEGMNVVKPSPRADAAQCEAFDRILGNHLLYCTVCDNNNGKGYER